MMTFTRNFKDDTVTVDHWDRKALFSTDFIEQRVSPVVNLLNDEIVVTVANGTARYRIVSSDTWRYEAELIEATSDVPIEEGGWI